MNIPLVNLKAQYQTIKKDIDNAIGKICTNSDFILGEDVSDFETSFARYVGASYCVGVASGTDAIKLMLMAAGIKKGDEIITQANTFIATVLPIIELGATPVLVDCDPTTGAINVKEVERAITRKTRAILPVHLYGNPAPMQELASLAKKQKLLLLEDAAQAHGSKTLDKHMGSIGIMSAFSFYPGKNLGAYGDGGAVVTNKKSYYDSVFILRNIGQKKKYDHIRLGLNSRLDTLHAAVLSVKLKHLEKWNTARNSIAQMYIDELTGVGDLILPQPSSRLSYSNVHLFVVRTQKRDALLKFLEKNGIHCGIHYPVPLHLTPALKFLGYKKGDFPASEIRARTMLSIPLYAELTQKEIKYITSTIKKFYTHDS